MCNDCLVIALIFRGMSMSIADKSLCRSYPAICQLARAISLRFRFMTFTIILVSIDRDLAVTYAHAAAGLKREKKCSNFLYFFILFFLCCAKQSPT